MEEIQETEIKENTAEETAEEIKSVKPAKGFGAGLGTGLAIGAVLLVLVMVIEAVVLSNALSSKSDILDSTTMQKVALIEKTIESRYYDYTPDDGQVTVQDMQEGVFDGIVDSLNDPYSDYYSAEEYEQIAMDNEGIYYGIGAYISLDDSGYAVFSGIMEDTPAEEAGLRAGDIIYEVDGTSTYGLSLDEVVSRVKGEEGTKVHLTIIREGEDDYLELDVTRAKVESPTVSCEMLENDIGYIHISSFDGVTADQFTECLAEVKEEGAKGLIIDLRSNLGGYVATAVSIAREILPEGVIVYEEDVNGKKTEYSCDGENELDIPLVVLVNSYSASASEILAGAIKDYEKGTLVGTTTYGKGIVQDSIRYSDGSVLKITTAAYYSPKGTNIQGTGIEPDIEAELDVDKYYEDGTDTQLQKGIEVLEAKIGQ